MLDLDNLPPEMTRLAHAMIDALKRGEGICFVDFLPEFPWLTEREFESVGDAMMELANRRDS